MNNKDSVYRFIIDNINSVLDDGIYYYDTVDEEFKNKLLGIKSYLDNIDKEEVIVEEEVTIEPVVELDLKDVYGLSRNYLSKITDIKLDILNLEAKLPLYRYEEPIIEEIKEEPIVEESIILPIVEEPIIEDVKVEEIEEKKDEIEDIDPIDMSTVFDDIMNEEDIVKEIKNMDMDENDLKEINVKSSIKDIFSK